MSKRSKKNECCCCKEMRGMDPCYNPCGNNGGFGGLFGGLGEGIEPIIFLLIACGSGLLNSGSSYLIILLFLLCGDSSIFGNLLGGCF